MKIATSHGCGWHWTSVHGRSSIVALANFRWCFMHKNISGEYWIFSKHKTFSQPCWLDVSNGSQPVKNWVYFCWWWRFDWSFSRLTAPVVTTTSIIVSSSNIQNGDILAPANPGKWSLKNISWLTAKHEIISVWHLSSYHVLLAASTANWLLLLLLSESSIIS